MKKVGTWVKSHIIILIVISVVVVVGIVNSNNGNKDEKERIFTRKYKEFLYCEDGYYLDAVNNKCIKLDTAEPLNGYDYVCPDLGFEWDLEGVVIYGSKECYVAVEEDFEYKDKCISFTPQYRWDEDTIESLEIDYYTCMMYGERVPKCPDGYHLDEDDEFGDSCVRVKDEKEALVYKVPIYENTDKNLPGDSCSNRAGGTIEKEMCADAIYQAEKRLSGRDYMYYEEGELKWNSVGSPAECEAMTITEENIVITKCTVTDIEKIRQYGSDELYVATLRTGYNNYYSNYSYQIGIAPTWEEAIKTPLDWYNSN